MARIVAFSLASLMITAGVPPALAEGKRLAAVPSAEKSAEGYPPRLAVDRDQETLWMASGKPSPDNNRVWFQLDVGRTRPLARLRWIAARGTPYPASVPAKFHVVVSDDGASWKPIADENGSRTANGDGDVVLNADARYVRLATDQVNDGTGWSLGLREIWVTEGRSTTAEEARFRPRVEPRDGAVRLTWTLPRSLRTSVLRIYRSDSPRETAGAPLSSLAGDASEYVDHVRNWTPHYYRLEAIDGRGSVVLKSPLAAGVAHPPERGGDPVETFAFWYEGYNPSTGPDPTIARIGDAAFVIGPPPEAAADLAKHGKGLLPYVTYYQTSGWTRAFAKDDDPAKVREAIAPVAFFDPSLRFTDSPRGYAPSEFCRPGNVEYDPKSVLYTACPNSAELRRRALALARERLNGGALGFFVDNGYDDDVAARAVCESIDHEHFYGEDLTSADAFIGLVLEVNCAVKVQNPAGIVMVNGGVPESARFHGLTLGDACDGLLWESFLRSSHSTSKQHISDWHAVYRRSVDLENGWNATPPRRVFVLSYPWDRAEAFFCYTSAKLCNLPWSACLGVNDLEHTHFGGHFGTYPELIGLRLGAPSRIDQIGGVNEGDVYWREYERGLVVVNPAKTTRRASIALGKSRRYHDVFTDRAGEGSSLAIELPAESGRVYLWR
jgi:hypothetical protein